MDERKSCRCGDSMSLRFQLLDCQCVNSRLETFGLYSLEVLLLGLAGFDHIGSRVSRMSFSGSKSGSSRDRSRSKRAILIISMVTSFCFFFALKIIQVARAVCPASASELMQEAAVIRLKQWLHTFDPVEKCTFIASCGNCGCQVRVWFHGHPLSVLTQQCPDLEIFENNYLPQWHKCLCKQCHFCGNQHSTGTCDRCGSRSSSRTHLVWPEALATTGMEPQHHQDRVIEAWDVIPSTVSPMGSSISCSRHGTLSSTGAFFHACASWKAEVVDVASPWPQWDPVNWASHLQTPQEVGLPMNPFPEPVQ
jgi:hypothetical protein